MTKQVIKKIFDWHLLPTNLSILSIYEFIMYTGFFAYFVYLYNGFQIVPEYDGFIYVQRVKNKSIQDTINISASIKYTIPYSYRFSESDSGRIVFQLYSEHQNNQRFVDYSNIPKSSKLNFINSSYEELTETFNELSDINIKTDYLNKSFKTHDFIYLNIFNNHSEYKRNNNESYGQWHYNSPYSFYRSYISPNGAGTETLFNAIPGYVYNQAASNMPYSRPKWYYLYDISQSYYTFNFDNNIKTKEISIDFVGATRFSGIYPVPDRTDMSSITYTDTAKINYIVENGLKFHAFHLEMDGIQESRLFFVSSVLAAIFALFVTFIVISLYKLRNKLKRNISINEKKTISEIKDDIQEYGSNQEFTQNSQNLAESRGQESRG